MPTLSANCPPPDRRLRKKLPSLVIDLVPTETEKPKSLPRNDSNVSLSVCIQDIPLSPTQHAEYTLSLTPESLKKKCRARKQPVIDIHACFDVNDSNGAISVVEDNREQPAVRENCKRYERDSIDLLERYDQIHAERGHTGEELALLTSHHQHVPHITRVQLLEHSCCR